ncbi:MAG: hypothetical protein SGARI_007916, partial [Bacillariaceae sp.]
MPNDQALVIPISRRGQHPGGNDLQPKQQLPPLEQQRPLPVVQDQDDDEEKVSRLQPGTPEYLKRLQEIYDNTCKLANPAPQDETLIVSSPAYAMANRLIALAHGLDHGVTHEEKALVDRILGLTSQKFPTPTLTCPQLLRSQDIIVGPGQQRFCFQETIFIVDSWPGNQYFAALVVAGNHAEWNNYWEFAMQGNIDGYVEFLRQFAKDYGL